MVTNTTGVIESFVLDGSKLKRLMHSNPTAKATLSALNERQRFRHYSNLNQTKNVLLKSGEKIVDADFMHFWKELQDMGIGSIVYGRNNNPDIFKWNYSLKEVAKTAVEGKDEKILPLSPPKATTRKRKPGRPRKAQRAATGVSAKTITLTINIPSKSLQKLFKHISF